MPEGDTIYRTAVSLRRWIGGRVITAARSSVAGLDATRLVDRKVELIEAQGKHLLIRLSGGLVLHTHMRMTGSWHVYPTGERWRRPARQARLVLEAGARSAVCFNAPVIELFADHDELAHPALRRLGPDVLEPASLDPAAIRARARARAGASPTIGELLLDQQVVAGIGNIYRCETLFVVGIHPWTPSVRVADATIDGLVTAASRLMLANATEGAGVGRSFDAGSDRTWVYRRGGLPCRRCRTAVERGLIGRQVRSVYWCPTCQPAS